MTKNSSKQQLITSRELKNKWGGKRKGSGRKRKNDPLIPYTVHITAYQAELLKMWGGGGLDFGLRWLINTSSHLIRRLTPEDRL